MITRRRFLESAAVAATFAHMESHSLMALSQKAVAKDDVLQWVDPRIGTGGHGHCYPGASMPFGAVQISPDTYTEGWDWCSGYHVTDSSIMGFSHTHLSGTGVGDLMDFLVMPGVGEAKLQAGSRENPEEGYRSIFRHETEVMHPGYYSVMLDTHQIKAEVTATERAGVHRYTFPESDSAYLIVDLYHGPSNKEGNTTVAEAGVKVAGAKIEGWHLTHGWANPRHSNFSMEVSKAPTRVALFVDDAPVSGTEARGKVVKAVLYFSTKANEQIVVKTGISATGVAGAAKNLAAEVPGFDFDGTRMKAEVAWRRQLGKVRASFIDDTHRTIFYTSLYHMSLGPVLFDDVDGRYRAMDNTVKTLPAGERNYTTFSLWDTFRGAHPAYTIIEPERVPQFVNTLIRMGEESPAGAPVWPLWGRETECMTGFHCSSVIAEAQKKGFNADYKRAYAMLQKGRADDVQGMTWHKEHGYIPADLEGESVSKHVEFCYDDWAMANIASRLGMTAERDERLKMSKGYLNNWDASVGFLRPKLSTGEWTTPFDPIEMRHWEKWWDYTESNAWQTTFTVQCDPGGMINMIGDNAKFVTKLDALFNQPSTLPSYAPPDIAGMVGQYAHGNEPSHHIAYLYVYAGAPHKTQSRVRSLIDTMYKAEPDGMQGNEDVGQMSAWYFLSALGFYPVDPVSGIYILGSPVTTGATLDMGKGRVLKIEVQRANASDCYVKEFRLNGKVQDKAWFRHSDIANGGTLTFVMSATPNETLGTDVKVIPPSQEI